MEKPSQRPDGNEDDDNDDDDYNDDDDDDDDGDDDDGEAKPETHRAPDVVDHVKHRHLGDASPHAGNRVKVEHQIPEGKVLLFETGGKPL